MKPNPTIRELLDLLRTWDTKTRLNIEIRDSNERSRRQAKGAAAGLRARLADKLYAMSEVIP